VKNLIENLRDRYKERVVIFDLPPLLNVDDAIAVLPQIDCVLMVVGNGMVTKHDMDESLRHLHTTNLLGVILNKAEVQQRNNYY
jgi:Mrp family chromosome partitioning ATPase